VLLSEVRAVKTLAARRQPKHIVLHLPFVECVASCTSSSLPGRCPFVRVKKKESRNWLPTKYFKIWYKSGHRVMTYFPKKMSDH